MLFDFLGIDLGGVLNTGIVTAGQVFTANTNAQIAALNAQAEAERAATAAAATQSQDSQIRLLIIGGLVLGAFVVARRALS